MWEHFCFIFGKSDYPTLLPLHGQLKQSKHAAGTGVKVVGEGFPAAEKYSRFLENMGAQVAASFRNLPGLSVCRRSETNRFPSCDLAAPLSTHFWESQIRWGSQLHIGLKEN